MGSRRFFTTERLQESSKKWRNPILANAMLTTSIVSVSFSVPMRRDSLITDGSRLRNCGGCDMTRKPRIPSAAQSFVPVYRLHNPCATLQQIAEKAGVSRQHVAQILKTEGLPTRHVDVRPRYQCVECDAPLKRDYIRYCSQVCKIKATRVPLECNTCGKRIFRRQWEVLSKTSGQGRGKRYTGNFYCNRSCFGLMAARMYGTKNLLAYYEKRKELKAHEPAG